MSQDVILTVKGATHTKVVPMGHARDIVLQVRENVPAHSIVVVVVIKVVRVVLPVITCLMDVLSVITVTQTKGAVQGRRHVLVIPVPHAMVLMVALARRVAGVHLIHVTLVVVLALVVMLAVTVTTQAYVQENVM